MGVPVGELLQSTLARTTDCGWSAIGPPTHFCHGQKRDYLSRTSQRARGATKKFIWGPVGGGRTFDWRRDPLCPLDHPCTLHTHDRTAARDWHKTAAMQSTITVLRGTARRSHYQYHGNRKHRPQDKYLSRGLGRL